MLKEFKAFALGGNVLDLAIGVMIGTAFNAVVGSLVQDILMNLIAAVAGKPDFSAIRWHLGDGVIQTGAFLTAVVNFLLIAFAMFLIVKAITRMMRPRGAARTPPSVRECPHCLTAIPVKATRCAACTSEVEPMAA